MAEGRFEDRDGISANHKEKVGHVAGPRHGDGLMNIVLLAPDCAADGIERTEKAGNEGGSVVPQIEMADAVNHEIEVSEKSQHGSFRVIDDVSRNIEAVPLSTEKLALPTIDVRHLEHKAAAGL